MTQDDIYDLWPEMDKPVIHPRAKVGQQCHLHKFVTVGTTPFTYVPKILPRQRKEVAAGVVIGNDVEIMSHSNVDLGTERDTVVGDGTKIDHFVHVGHDSRIGKNCILAAGTIIGGFVEMGDDVYCGIHTTIKPRVKIGAGSYLGAGAVVLEDVPAGQVWVGNPARFHGPNERSKR